MKNLSQFSQRNLSVIENFILHFTHGEEHPMYAEMMQSAKDYIDEDHADGEESEEAIEEHEAKHQAEKLENAKRYLVGGNSDEEFLAMIKLIEEHEDEHEIIDYIEGVEVWEKVEFSFTCKQFMQEITPLRY